MVELLALRHLPRRNPSFVGEIAGFAILGVAVLGGAALVMHSATSGSGSSSSYGGPSPFAVAGHDFGSGLVNAPADYVGGAAQGAGDAAAHAANQFSAAELQSFGGPLGATPIGPFLGIQGWLGQHFFGGR